MLKSLPMRYLMLLFLLAGTLLGTTSSVAVVIVDFPDENLETAVRNTLNIPTAPITDADMLTLGQIKAIYSNITEIRGLEYAVNMTEMDLNNNQISDISMINQLTNLNDLNLQGNQISDLSAVAGLTNLTTLNLSANQISNISAVSGLTNLTTLDIVYNQISDLSAVAGLTNLTRLALFHNQINDISALAGLTNMESLFLYENQITDISAIAGMTELSLLNLRENQISDISALAGIPELFVLVLSQNQVSDISALAGNTKISHLELNNNQVSDISTVAGLTTLQNLHLDDNQVSDISAISGLTDLWVLSLRNNQITTLNFSNTDLSSLYKFDISGNPVTNVLLRNAKLNQGSFDTLMNPPNWPYGLADLTTISKLDMSGVDFVEISSLASMYRMDALETLLLIEATNLEGSQVASLTEQLYFLNYLDVTGLWETFDVETQDLLTAWDGIEGNTLITEPIPGDANGDGKVDGSDVTILAGNWQYGADMTTPDATWAMGDFNGDGKVDGSDVTILAGKWQSGVTSTVTAVPEPATLVMLLALVGVALLRRRTRSI